MTGWRNMGKGRKIALSTVFVLLIVAFGGMAAATLLAPDTTVTVTNASQEPVEIRLETSKRFGEKCSSARRRRTCAPYPDSYFEDEPLEKTLAPGEVWETAFPLNYKQTMVLTKDPRGINEEIVSHQIGKVNYFVDVDVEIGEQFDDVTAVEDGHWSAL